MGKIEKILLCGIGAVGLTFASKFQKYSPDCIKVLVDEKRLKRYKQKPLRLNGEEKFFDYILPSNTDYKPDLIIISTKMDGLESVLENLKNFVDEKTFIMPIINGITAENIVVEKYGRERTVGGYFIGHSAMRVNNEVVHDGVGKIVFSSCEPIAEFFSRAGIDFEIPQDFQYAKWVKFGLNIISNQTSCILKMTFGDMQKSKEFHKFARNILREIVELAHAEGVLGWENLENDVIKSLDLMSADGRTSMLQDIEAGKKTELDIFAGTVIKLGKKHGIPTPYNQTLYEMIRILEEL